MSGGAKLSLAQRIRREIEGNIDSGRWPPGYRVPSEHELMQRYGCSRMTVNKVLSGLAGQGLIERRRRAGSFVARPRPMIESVALEIPDIPREVSERGYAYDYRLLARRLRACKSGHAQEAALSVDGKVLELECLHFADHAPFALEQRLLSPAASPDVLEVDFTSQAPGTWLLQQVQWTRARHRIAAVNLDAAQAHLLESRVDAAALLIERQTWAGEQPVTHVRQFFLGDAYDLVAQVMASGRRSD